MKIIDGRNDIVKDPITGAVINIDSDAHRAAVESAKARESAKDQLTTNTNDINSIKEELFDIKNMMRQLLGSMNDDGR
tara:strand:+ start:726 stop:959 length:234 start_codon:yes stop_codon:yes gene_type:complete